jgi:DNA-binding SARP family transcriptional activator
MSSSPGVGRPVSDVRLHLIDGFELRCDGETVRLPLGSQRLVAYLALHSRPLLRIHVAGTLWNEASESRSCANLRSALWRVRDRSSAVVTVTPSHLGLGREVVVDVREVVALARGLLDEPDGEPVEAHTAQLEGDLLPDWYDDWLTIERERLRQLRVHALERIAERALSQRRFGPAIDSCLAAIAADPLRESAHRLLIRAYLAEGNISAGLRQYREYCRRAYEELGLGPSAQLREVASLLRGGTNFRPGAGEVPSRAPSSALPS